MGFNEAYAGLESAFLEQVRLDNADGWPHAHYVSNFVSKGPVDFVLIAMEASLGGGQPHDPATCECIDSKSKNFAFSIEDFILHFCIRRYLCQGGKTYHLTDLAKGQMSADKAKHLQWQRWERWYPLLETELRLVAKPGAPVISIGKEVERFLMAQEIEKHVGSIVHFSKNNGKAQKKAAEEQPVAYDEFRSTVTASDLENTVRDVLKCEPNAPDIKDTLSRLQIHSRFSEHKRKLMFAYKVKFETWREQANAK